jgi:rod shape-determining protein MreC
MLKRPQILLLSAALLLVIVLLNLPSQAASRIKLAISGIFLPLFGLAGSAQKLGDSAGLRAVPKGVLIAEVEQLRRENEELKLQVAEAKEVERENEVLRKAVSWQPRIPWRRRLARVVSRDPANWWRTLQIDAGTRDGIVSNLPVVTPDGLVGRIDEVGLFTSRVVLLGDPKCKVAAIVDSPTRDTKGVIMPGEASILDESIVEMRYLTANSTAIPGQKVHTSGLGGIFPKGIPIGEIIRTNSVDFGLYMEAQVKLSANLNELEEVWVLLP